MMRAVNTAIRLVAETFDPSGPIVEVGSYYLAGNEQLSNLRPYFPGREYIGCDVRPGSGVDRLENAESLTFANGSVGAFVSCDMIGHTPRPARVVAEARRVLRDDGIAAITAPFSYRLNGFPTDYWRFTASGLWVLFDEAGFEDITVFSLGPSSKPRVVIGVAAAVASEEHARRKRQFEQRAIEAYSRNRLHAHLDTMEKAGRDLIGTMVGRAKLGVAFFDPAQQGGYFDVTVGPNAGGAPSAGA
jgi:SAM-dependent methyltransferase